MLIITVAANSEPDEKVLGVVGCERIAPINDYEFIATNSQREFVTTSLRAYSRWTEPAFGLLARLLRHHPRDTDRPAPGAHLRSTIYLGRDTATARVIERIEGRMDAGVLQLKFTDEFGARESQHPARVGYSNPLDLLEHVARLAAWGVDEEPAIPPPLTEVPVHEDGGFPYVLEKDIPAFALRHFELRCLQGTAPRPHAFYAQDWWRFIGGKK